MGVYWRQSWYPSLSLEKWCLRWSWSLISLERMFQVLRLKYVLLLFDGLICMCLVDPTGIQCSRGPMFLHWFSWCQFAYISLASLPSLFTTWSVWVLQKQFGYHLEWISLYVLSQILVFVNICFISLTRLDFIQKLIVDYWFVIFWILMCLL